MKLLSRSLCLFLGLLFIFLSSNVLAGTCDDCADCINDIKGVISYIPQVQKIVDNYQCFQTGGKYILNFTPEEVKFITNSKPIVVKPQEGHIVEINNLNLGEAEGVDKDLFLIINGPNVSINPPIFTGGSIEITSSNVSISGGTVGGITITSSASDVVISGTDISGNVAISGKEHTIENSTAQSITIGKDTSNVMISNVNIVSNGGTGIEVAGQQVTIAQPDFLGDIATPILLAEGANANVKPPDIAKVFRKMSEDDTVVKEIVGIVGEVGNVEVFKKGQGEILHQKACGVDLKENTDYSNSDLIPANLKIFVCKDLALQVKDYVSFTFTDSDGNTSAMPEPIELVKFGKIFSVPPPPVDTPAPTGPGVKPSSGDDVLSTEEQKLVTTTGDGIDGSDENPTTSCMSSLAGAATCSPYQLLMLLFPMAVLFVRRMFR